MKNRNDEERTNEKKNQMKSVYREKMKPTQSFQFGCYSLFLHSIMQTKCPIETNRNETKTIQKTIYLQNSQIFAMRQIGNTFQLIRFQFSGEFQCNEKNKTKKNYTYNEHMYVQHYGYRCENIRSNRKKRKTNRIIAHMK